MDISINKPAKDFLKRKFEEWYCKQVIDQLADNDEEDFELQPVDLSLSALKEEGWWICLIISVKTLNLL